MNRTTYRNATNKLREAKRDSFDKSHEIHQRMSEIHRLKMACIERGESTAELDDEYGELREKLAELDAERKDIGRQLDAHEEAVADGYDYVRPEYGRSGRLLNRLLPSVPEGVKEVKAAEPASTHAWFIAGLSGVVTALVVAASLASALCWAAWLIETGPLFVYFVPGEPVPLDDKVIGFFAGIILLLGVVVINVAFAWPRGFLTNALERQCRFLLGAESWSWRSRLRALAVFAVVSPGTFFVPLLAVPLRFVTGFVGMLMYLRRYKKSGSRSEAIAVPAQYTNCVARTLVGLAGLAVVAAAFVLLQM